MLWNFAVAILPFDAVNLWAIINPFIHPHLFLILSHSSFALSLSLSLLLSHPIHDVFEVNLYFVLGMQNWEDEKREKEEKEG